jgi:hypothetical protein
MAYSQRAALFHPTPVLFHAPKSMRRRRHHRYPYWKVFADLSTVALAETAAAEISSTGSSSTRAQQHHSWYTSSISSCCCNSSTATTAAGAAGLQSNQQK